MIKTITYLCMFYSIFCCGQQEPTNTQETTMYNIEDYIAPEAKDITADNFVEKIFQEIQHYPEEPLFYLRVHKQNCLIEILVNGRISHVDEELSNYATPIEINGQIYKSGEQTVTVRMYPVGNLVNESYGREGEPITTLLDNSSVEIQVIEIDNKSDKSFEDEKLIVEHTSPKEKDKFVGSGKPYYEYTFSFNAQVPYEFEAWSNGQDLRKLDQKLLEKKAIEYYTMLQNVYKNGDLNGLLKLEYPAGKRIFISTYSKKNEIEFSLEYDQTILDRSYTIIPIQNYRMDFTDNGKVLFFREDKNEVVESAVKLSYYKGESGYYRYIGYSLYLPKGRSLEDGLMMIK